MNKKILPSLVAEFIGTFTLIFIGILAIHNASGNGGLLLVAFAHGLAIAVMVSAFGHISGGHLNPAVTLGALVAGKICVIGASLYWIS
jgi:glycerol uptake facilitator-like aquaporin